jgi:hypothetical protein
MVNANTFEYIHIRLLSRDLQNADKPAKPASVSEKWELSPKTICWPDKHWVLFPRLFRSFMPR